MAATQGDPNVVGERSSQRVLTLEFEPGDNINKLDEAGYTQKERDSLGRSLWHMMARQLLQLGAIHGDHLDLIENDQPAAILDVSAG